MAAAADDLAVLCVRLGSADGGTAAPSQQWVPKKAIRKVASDTLIGAFESRVAERWHASALELKGYSPGAVRQLSRCISAEYLRAAHPNGPPRPASPTTERCLRFTCEPGTTPQVPTAITADHSYEALSLAEYSCYPALADASLAQLMDVFPGEGPIDLFERAAAGGFGELACTRVHVRCAERIVQQFGHDADLRARLQRVPKGAPWLLQLRAALWAAVARQFSRGGLGDAGALVRYLLSTGGAACAYLSDAHTALLWRWGLREGDAETFAVLLRAYPPTAYADYLGGAAAPMFCEAAESGRAEHLRALLAAVPREQAVVLLAHDYYRAFRCAGGDSAAVRAALWDAAREYRPRKAMRVAAGYPALLAAALAGDLPGLRWLHREVYAHGGVAGEPHVVAPEAWDTAMAAALQAGQTQLVATMLAEARRVEQVLAVAAGLGDLPSLRAMLQRAAPPAAAARLPPPVQISQEAYVGAFLAACAQRQLGAATMLRGHVGAADRCRVVAATQQGERALLQRPWDSRCEKLYRLIVELAHATGLPRVPPARDVCLDAVAGGHRAWVCALLGRLAPDQTAWLLCPRVDANGRVGDAGALAVALRAYQDTTDAAVRAQQAALSGLLAGRLWRCVQDACDGWAQTDDASWGVRPALDGLTQAWTLAVKAAADHDDDAGLRLLAEHCTVADWQYASRVALRRRDGAQSFLYAVGSWLRAAAAQPSGAAIPHATHLLRALLHRGRLTSMRRLQASLVEAWPDAGWDVRVTQLLREPDLLARALEAGQAPLVRELLPRELTRRWERLRPHWRRAWRGGPASIGVIEECAPSAADFASFVRAIDWPDMLQHAQPAAIRYALQEPAAAAAFTAASPISLERALGARVELAPEGAMSVLREVALHARVEPATRLARALGGTLLRAAAAVGATAVAQVCSDLRRCLSDAEVDHFLAAREFVVTARGSYRIEEYHALWDRAADITCAAWLAAGQLYPLLLACATDAPGQQRHCALLQRLRVRLSGDPLRVDWPALLREPAVAAVLGAQPQLRYAVRLPCK